MRKFFVILSIFFAVLAAEGCLCAEMVWSLLGLDNMDVSDYTGSWHSPYPCDESESEPYKWGINLNEDDENYVQGTIYFHNCPGGGVVIYHVAGWHKKDVVPLQLEGIITGGRGDLKDNSPLTQVFHITFKQPPDPNFTQ
jgi:hypothetical protein